MKKNLINQFYPSILGRLMLLSVLMFSMQQLAAEDVAEIPYSCNFSDPTENANWELNIPTTSTNLWYIGNPGEADADGVADGNFLYMSSDEGLTNSYDGSACIVMSYRTINFSEVGTYDLGFDWRALGARDVTTDPETGEQTVGNTTAELFVLLYPESLIGMIDLKSQLSYTDAEPFSFMCKLTFDGDTLKKSLYGYTDWTHATSQMSIAKNSTGNYRLVFVWTNKKATAYPPGGSVDNIEIAKATCGMPQDADAYSLNNEATFTWTGTADSYELQYSIINTYNWTTITGITGDPTASVQKYVASNVPNGIYDVKIRSICNTDDPLVSDTSVWASFTEIFVYEKECVDYIKLDNAYCTTGSFENPYSSSGRVNFGYESSYSRHTLHYDQTEYDPRTNYGLKTVPDDAVASVRLGNWEVNAQAESITYDYVVDTSYASIMLMKYAVVIEAPGHGADADPKFELEILDEDGQLLDATCGTADFTATGVAVGENGWSVSYSGTSEIFWKDWTTVGLNLNDYHGRTLQIRLTTYDCAQSAHYGYAYFTLGCTVDAIAGIACGAEVNDSFVAPEGFYYKWYKKSDASQTALSYDRVYYLTDLNDTATYCVDVIYPTDSRCQFTLEAQAIPRFPVAQFSYDHTPENCQNKITIYNESFIELFGVKSDDLVEDCYWNFGGGTEFYSMDSTLVVDYPDEGYRGSVTLTAYVADQMCDSSITVDIYVPAISSVTEITEIILCQGDSVFVSDYVADNDSIIITPGDYSYVTKSAYSGCDSTLTLRVVEVPTYNDTIETSLKSTETYQHEGESEILSDPGDYPYYYQTVDGCDSTVTITINMFEALEVVFNQMGEICHLDDSIAIPINIISGSVDTIIFTYSQEALAVGFADMYDIDFHQNFDTSGVYVIPMPENILPGAYDVTIDLIDFVKEFDTDVTQMLTFDIRYDTCILAQRWLDVIGVKNENYNDCGGLGASFNFTEFQWYENDSLIDGATGSNLYVPEGLDLNSYYTVRLVRSSDGVAQYTCQLIPSAFTGSDNVDVSSVATTRTLFGPNETEYLEVDSDVTIRFWSVLGRVVSQQVIPAGGGSVQAPSIRGVYIMETIVNGLVNSTTKIIVK